MQQAVAKVAAVRQEAKNLAAEIRGAYAAITPLPYTSTLVSGLVQSSAMLKKVKMDDGTHRICYVYALAVAWSPKRPTGNETDKRAYRPQVIWKAR